MNDGGSREVNAFIRNKRGRRVPVLFRVQPVRAADGSIIGAVEIFKDDSARRVDRRKAEEMQRLAFLDSLTKAPNRRFLQMSLQTAMHEYQVTKVRFGVLLIDLDSFKAINDSFGHAKGDRALQRAAKTFVGALRPTDAVGRWGGDEFLAIVRNVSIEILNDLAKRCVAMVGQISISGNGSRPIHMSISVGGTLNRPNDTARSLVGRADRFLYESKTSGRGCATTR
jgi:diguanylate cyclase (GGDEF)-like protein